MCNVLVCVRLWLVIPCSRIPSYWHLLIDTVRAWVGLGVASFTCHVSPGGLVTSWSLCLPICCPPCGLAPSAQKQEYTNNNTNHQWDTDTQANAKAYAEIVA
jgi:hypothetical protein